jgi:carbon storage regulator
MKAKQGFTLRGSVGTHSETGPLFQMKGIIMLVLSRYPEESVMIGDTVKVTVLEVHGDKVRLGITAPSDIPVHRQEIYRIIQQEKQEVHT